MELGVVLHLKIYFCDCENLQFEHEGVVIGRSKANEPKTTRLTSIYRVHLAGFSCVEMSQLKNRVSTEAPLFRPQ